MTTTLPNVSVSPLRQKLIDDMTMRHFSAATRLPVRQVSSADTQAATVAAESRTN